MKKLIVITADSYIRNYLDTDAFSEILDNDTRVCAAEHLHHLDRLNALPGFVGTFSYGEEEKKKYTFLFNVLMMRYQDRSRTFGFRYRRLWFALRIRQNQLRQKIRRTRAYRVLSRILTPAGATCVLALTRYTKVVRHLLKDAAELLVIKALGRPGLAEWTQRRFEREVAPNRQLQAILQQVRPDLVLIPSQGIEPTGTDLLRLQKKHGFQTLFLIDNWDNLSSKSVFPYPPGYLGVWGQQSVDHAETIHNIEADRVFKLGTPRFDEYFHVFRQAANGKPPTRPFAFPYILFTGCSLPYDETTALFLLDQTLAGINQHREQPVTLVYRPHPWRLKRLDEVVFQESDFRHVVLDPSVRDCYYQRLGDSFQPSLGDYPGLLYHAELVVGPLTSMLVEAALFNKRILALAYDDGIHLTAPHNALRYYKHFEGIERVPGFELIQGLGLLPERLQQALATTDEPLQDTMDSILDYYLHQDERPYARRLRDVVGQISSLQADRTSLQPVV